MISAASEDDSAVQPQDWMTSPETLAVLDALEASGAHVRFVGGCVRDALLGRAVSDIDIATDAVPEKVVDALSAAGIKSVPTGLSHGTVTAVVQGHPFEITTLRRDVETDGRYATVAFTDDWTEDAARRDFTINAISLDRDGTLHDPFGGVEDIKLGRVRFVGVAKERIEEDVLRLLRFFRFHAHYGKEDFDADGLAACREMAPMLTRLSVERVWTELRKLLAAADPTPVVRTMLDAGILQVLLPEAQHAGRLGRLVRIEAEMVKAWPAVLAADPIRRLGALLSVDRPGAEAIALRLKAATVERERLASIAEGLVAPPDISDPPSIRRLLYRMPREQAVDVALVAWAEWGETPWRDVVAEAATWQPPAFPIAGRDAAALGVPQGPSIGEALREVEDWWIAEDFRPDREACLAKLRAVVEA